MRKILVFGLLISSLAYASPDCRIALHVDVDFTANQADRMKTALEEKGYEVRLTTAPSEDRREYSGYIGMDHHWDLFHRYASIDISRPGETLHKEYLHVTTGIFWNRATRKIVKALKDIPSCEEKNDETK